MEGGGGCPIWSFRQTPSENLTEQAPPWQGLLLPWKALFPECSGRARRGKISYVLLKHYRSPGSSAGTQLSRIQNGGSQSMPFANEWRPKPQLVHLPLLLPHPILPFTCTCISLSQFYPPLPLSLSPRHPLCTIDISLNPAKAKGIYKCTKQ